MQKFREFWITKSRRAYDSEGDLLPSDEVRIHVIEYSAYEKLREQLAVAVEALEKITNHKQTSVDKVYLIHQCEGYQTVARKALDALEEALQKIRGEG